MKVEQKGLQEAIAKTTNLRNLLGSAAKVKLDIPATEVRKLEYQAALDRNPTNIEGSEKQEVKDIVKRHVEAARDASGRISGSYGDWYAMHRELGEWMRGVIADKIEDKRYTYKRPLTDAYRRWKVKYFGTLPILVLTKKLLNAVRSARVSVGRK